MCLYIFAWNNKNVKDNLGLERDELNILNLHLNCFYLKQNLEAP